MRSVRKRNPLWIMEGEVVVDGKVVCSGTVTAAAA
jgi:3-hydroxymyristoyl/3-hydroxydecanoyl-(acyl carrier protein) dehydratase